MRAGFLLTPLGMDLVIGGLFLAQGTRPGCPYFIIQLSYTVRIPIFLLADLYHVILVMRIQLPCRHYCGVIAMV